MIKHEVITIMSKSGQITIDGNHLLKFNDYNRNVLVFNDGPANLYFEVDDREQIDNDGSFIKEGEQFRITETVDYIALYSESETSIRYISI